MEHTSKWRISMILLTLLAAAAALFLFAEFRTYSEKGGDQVSRYLVAEELVEEDEQERAEYVGEEELDDSPDYDNFVDEDQDESMDEEEEEALSKSEELISESVRMVAGVPIYSHSRRKVANQDRNGGRSLAGNTENSYAYDWIFVMKHDSDADAVCKSAICSFLGSQTFAKVTATDEDIDKLVLMHSSRIEMVDEDQEINTGPQPSVSDDDEGEAALVADIRAAKSNARSKDSELPPWNLDRIDARAGFDGEYDRTGYNGSGVHVYVFDTGIYTYHHEFERHRTIPTLEAYDRMFNICDPTNMSCAMDYNGHGTHVAGTVGGKKYGVSPGVTLHAVKVLNDEGSGAYSSIISAIEWVGKNGKRPGIMSMSLGGPQSKALNKIIASVTAAGFPVVAAAGNDNVNAKHKSPASAPSAITVGATDIFDRRASFSNFGALIDIWAPGVSIKSAWIRHQDDTQTLQGTSMACPHVSGYAAQLLQEDPTLAYANHSRGLAAMLTQRSTPNVLSHLSALEDSPRHLLYTNPKGKNEKWSVPGHHWKVLNGDCYERNGCIHSPPESNQSQSCTIFVNSSASQWNGTAIDVKNFYTKSGYLFVNDHPHHQFASLLPYTVPTGWMSWYSRENFVGSWSICTTSTTTKPLEQMHWRVTKGSCVASRFTGCVSSPNYPRPYGNYDECTIEVQEKVWKNSSAHIKPSYFNTEHYGYDHLTVNGQKYFSGRKGVSLLGLIPKGNITWLSDYKNGKSFKGRAAWELCPSTDAIATTTTTTTLASFWWHVVSGSCRISEATGCATSPNFPERYGPSETCTIKVNAPQYYITGLNVVQFDTESNYDFLYVNGKRYSGHDARLLRQLRPQGHIKWSSDRSVSGAGWMMCLNHVDPLPKHPGALKVETGTCQVSKKTSCVYNLKCASRCRMTVTQDGYDLRFGKFHTKSKLSYLEIGDMRYSFNQTGRHVSLGDAGDSIVWSSGSKLRGGKCKEKWVLCPIKRSAGSERSKAS